MAKNDLRYVKVEDAIQDAFFELLGELPLEKISITKICERARCSRNAFYDHYESRDDLYEKIVADFAEAVHDVGRRANSDARNWEESALDSSLDFFDTIYERRDMLKRILNTDNGVVEHQLKLRIADVFITEAEEYVGRPISFEQRLASIYGACGAIGFMIHCIKNPDIDWERARAAFGLVQERVTAQSWEFMQEDDLRISEKKSALV